MRPVLILAFVILILPQARAATFQWQSTTPGVTATIEIDDDAAKGGTIASDVNVPGPPQDLSENPIIRFQITAYGDTLFFDRTNARGFYTFDVSVVGNTLAGDIHVNDLSTDTYLSGTEGSWTIANHHSDHPGPCFRANNKCGGEAGHWVLVQPAAAVAEDIP